VSFAEGKTTKRRDGASALSARVFSRLAVLLAAFALFAQLVALPYHRADARPDLSSLAAALKAEFGDSAIPCAQADDPLPGSNERRQGHCDDACPLCQFAAQTVLLAAPAPSLAARVEVAAAPMRAHADCVGENPGPTGVAQARAPPAQA
jgi:hypothetical protein